MNERVKKLWLKALRSGEYQQGRGQLAHPSKEDFKKACNFCCLGVLQDLFCLEKGSPMNHYFFDEDTNTQDAKRWAEISNGDTAELVDRNDGHNGNFVKPQSFKQIANYIEKHL